MKDLYDEFNDEPRACHQKRQDQRKLGDRASSGHRNSPSEIGVVTLSVCVGGKSGYWCGVSV